MLVDYTSSLTSNAAEIVDACSRVYDDGNAALARRFNKVVARVCPKVAYMQQRISRTFNVR